MIVGGVTKHEGVLKGHNIREVENYCFRICKKPLLEGLSPYSATHPLSCIQTNYPSDVSRKHVAYLDNVITFFLHLWFYKSSITRLQTKTVFLLLFPWLSKGFLLYCHRKSHPSIPAFGVQNLHGTRAYAHEHTHRELLLEWSSLLWLPPLTLISALKWHLLHNYPTPQRITLFYSLADPMVFPLYRPIPYFDIYTCVLKFMSSIDLEN